MAKNIYKVVYSRLSDNQKEKAARYYHNFRRLLFSPQNVKAALIRPFLKNRKINNINLLEQCFYSQNGEDGIIRAIFDKIKTTNRFCVEFGITSNEGNSVYLKKNGWECLWMDGIGDGENIKKEYITAENINELFEKYNVPKEFDLLSIDIDSNDYWVWKAIQGYSPRVVIMEYNASIPPTESKTIKYDPTSQWDGTNYFGASLLALKKLGDSKGYTLIACDNRTINSFFVRNDLVGDHFKVKNIEDIYRNPKYGKKVNGKRIGHPPSKKSMISV